MTCNNDFFPIAFVDNCDTYRYTFATENGLWAARTKTECEAQIGRCGYDVEWPADGASGQAKLTKRKTLAELKADLFERQASACPAFISAALTPLRPKLDNPSTYTYRYLVGVLRGIAVRGDDYWGQNLFADAAIRLADAIEREANAGRF